MQPFADLRVELHYNAREDHADHRHQLDKDVQAGAGSVLAGVAHGVTDYGGLMCLGTLAAVCALFDVLLGVVPGAACVVERDCQDKAACQASCEKAHHTGHA